MISKQDQMRDLIENHKNDTALIESLKERIKATEKAMTELASPIMGAKLLDTKKHHGSFKLDVHGVPLQCEIRKTIKWDSGALAEIAKRIPSADAAVIFTASLSVSEEQFETLKEFDHPALGEIILAREVKYSPLSVKPIKAKD